ncbi:MAG: carbon starvation protein A, partial [Clostridia bacterium]|nr:carbon starvation protein A [Clostridia bacterium]
SKQLDKEKDAKPIAYGGMLIECALAIMTLIAVAHAFSFNGTDLAFSGATQIFGGGIASMIDPSRGTVYSVLYTLLVLTYSTFCLTSLDTATRMGRFMFQEFWLDGTKGETPENVTGYKKILSNPYVATLITVVLGITLGMNGYGKIWALFGSANQLLAALALLAIAAWLGNVGRKNAMCWIPMFFMLFVTLASLFINTKTQFGLIAAGGADWGPWAQAILGVLLMVLAVVLAIEGVQTIFFKNKKKAAK